jgi:hypothetical protein
MVKVIYIDICEADQFGVVNNLIQIQPKTKRVRIQINYGVSWFGSLG